ncbi:MAG: arylesterase [Gammaproteobacteria bacterium]|nr:arylesterase [Gammaproteobacteria bacterium]
MKKQKKKQQVLLSTLFQTTIILISLIITFPYEDVSASESSTHKSLLVFGDSLSAGYGITTDHNWTDLLQNKLNEHNKKIQLINASISGDTTANGLNRLPQALKQFQPDFILIELGANDGLRGLSLSHIRKNLELLIQSSIAANTEVILMEILIPPNYGKKYTLAFKQIYHQLANKYSLTLLPFFLQDIAINPELMQADGLHPNEQAQSEIADIMWQSLKPLF